MAVWLCRTGNEVNESKALQEGKVLCIDSAVRKSFNEFPDFHSLVDVVQVELDLDYESAEAYTEELWSFCHDMQLSDIVIMQNNNSPVIHLGMVTGDYDYISFNNPDQQHYRNVSWFTTNLPLTAFSDDVIKLFDTDCTISKLPTPGKLLAFAFNALGSKTNDTPESYSYKVKRDREVTKTYKKPACMVNLNDHKLLNDVLTEHIFIVIDDMVNKDKARDIIKVFLGVLKAKGFKPSLSPASNENCIDIMAISNFEKLGGNNLGVQLHLDQAPVDVDAMPGFKKLMNTFGSDYGLLIAWNGYTKALENEIDNLGGKVALWTSRDVLRELLKYYDMLDDANKAILPLKKIWIMDEKADPL